MAKKQRKFADDGWALWIDGDDRSTFYLNEWINPKGKSYVDISIRIYGTKNVRTVNIFCPFIVEQGELTDLSNSFSNHEIMKALFNANGTVKNTDNEYISELCYNDRTVSLIRLGSENITTKNISHGTVITLDFESIKSYIETDETYIIFRVPHKTLDKIFAPSIDVHGIFDRINYLVLSPIISEKYGYSIRINEARLLPHEINNIDILHQQRIRKVLVTISINDEYEMNDSTCYRIRRLEEELNKCYAPESYDCSNVVTYEWMEQRDSNMRSHYNFFFTMEHRKISHISMMIYLMIFFFCSALGCALYEVLKILFTNI